MRADRERTESYANAIRLAAPGRVCLDIGTGSLALLAVIAARAGAKHVYAIEANAEAASQARALVADEGLADVITIVEGYSTDVVLPENVDLLLHEILGEVAGAEGVVAAVRDAAARHWTAPDGLNEPDAGATRSVASVPARALSLVGPAEFPSSEYFASLPFPMIAAPGSTIFKLPGLPRSTLLAPPAIFEDLDFEAAAPMAEQSRELEFAVRRDGSAIRVSTTASLGTAHPRYTFEVWLLPPAEEKEKEAHLLGKLSYPE